MQRAELEVLVTDRLNITAPPAATVAGCADTVVLSVTVCAVRAGVSKSKYLRYTKKDGEFFHDSMLILLSPSCTTC